MRQHRASARPPHGGRSAPGLEPIWRNALQPNLGIHFGRRQGQARRGEAPEGRSNGFPRRLRGRLQTDGRARLRTHDRGT